MITESFINLCCVILLDSDNQQITEQVKNDIFVIFHTYEEEDVAIQFRKKFELAQTILKLRMDNKTGEEAIDTIVASGHFSELDSYIKGIESRKLTPEKVVSAIKQINERKQYCCVVHNDLPKIEDFIKKVRSNEFTDLGEAVGYWKDLVPQINSRVLEDKRKESGTSIKELDMFGDSFEEVLNSMALNFSGERSISTGYKNLDKYMNGGFEPNRLYVYAGTSGDGKSTLLLNFLKNAVETNKNMSGPYNICTYYSLENTIDETLVRLYCSIMNQKTEEVRENYAEKRKTIERELKDWQMDHHSIVALAYFPATITSMSDITTYNNMVAHRYENHPSVKGKLGITFVDYLDLLKSGQTFDLHRIELGQVTIDMKVAAVMSSIPYVTVTPLNRGAYNAKESPSLANIGESIKKVENADHVSLIKNLIEEKDEDNIQVRPEVGEFKVNILKNRNGPKEVYAMLKSNFSKFRIFDENSPDNGLTFSIPKGERFTGEVF